MTIELARALTNSLGITINSEDAPRLYANLQNIVSHAAIVEREACAELVEDYYKPRTHTTFYNAAEQIRTRGQLK